MRCIDTVFTTLPTPASCSAQDCGHASYSWNTNSGKPPSALAKCLHVAPCAFNVKLAGLSVWRSQEQGSAEDAEGNQYV